MYFKKSLHLHKTISVFNFILIFMKSFSKIIFTLIAIAGFSQLSAAKNPPPFSRPTFITKADGQKNVAKMSLFRIINPLHKDIDFGYERVITDHFSISASLAFKIPNIPAVIADNFDSSPTAITDDNGLPIATQSVTLSPLKGIGFTPEFKFYTSKENEAPHGFYVAPYLKYYRTSMSASSTVNFVDPAQQDVSLDVTMRFTEFGGGLQLGYQWVIGPGITIDWYFLGPRVSKFNFNLLFEGNIGDPDFFTDAEEEMKTSFKDIPVFGGSVSTTATSNSLELKAPFWFPNLRSGIAIGAAF